MGVYIRTKHSTVLALRFENGEPGIFRIWYGGEKSLKVDCIKPVEVNDYVNTCISNGYKIIDIRHMEI